MLNSIEIGETKIHQTPKIKFLGTVPGRTIQSERLHSEMNKKKNKKKKKKKTAIIQCSSITSTNTATLTSPKCYLVP